ncbi:hypothetical protein BU17DRAFT_96164 [Hysterangium stoloniferum]|nr:hypothetical protein BU17DRAFT_96164 [Hysterangium stoloniferum]
MSRRTVEYVKTTNMWDAASGIKSLPGEISMSPFYSIVAVIDDIMQFAISEVQWGAWLSHSRGQPPTIEELTNDRLRQERLAVNVARLKEQDEAEIRRTSQKTSLQVPSESQIDVPRAPPSQPIGPTAEPQPWTPLSTKRG